MDASDHSECRERCAEPGCTAGVYDDHEFIPEYDDWQGEEPT